LRLVLEVGRGLALSGKLGRGRWGGVVGTSEEPVTHNNHMSQFTDPGEARPGRDDGRQPFQRRYLHIGDSVSDHASTSDTSSGTGNSSEHTGLPLLTHGLGRYGMASRGGLGRVGRGRGLSSLLVRRSRSRGSSSGRSGRSGLSGHNEVCC
jgi:hypothetical protein